MEAKKKSEANTATTIAAGENDSQWVSFEVPLHGSAAFDLETAVCSHGLFMMAPNRWDPLTKTLQRPLRLRDPQCSVVTAIISQTQRHHNVIIGVRSGTRSLSPSDREALLAQVKRMLRLSESDERVCREFSEVYCGRSSVVGRVFRSPSLFEDMVKCILLCNCSWPRTLSMAQALCDLQLELKMQSVSANSLDFIPKTPSGKELKRKVEKSNAFECLGAELAAHDKAESDLQSSNTFGEDKAQPFSQNSSPSSSFPVHMENDSCGVDSDLICHPQLLNDCDFEGIGDFPTPLELSKLDVNFLAKRCKLGYRAKRVLNLALGIVEGRIQLREMEETCRERSLSSYSKLDEQLRQIYGFGPFTRANVLMCMGFYHVVPSDSETIRHLKQVHGKNSSIRRITEDVQQMYAKYEPFQFLAYWSELWHFYEMRFGKFSEMPYSEYKLVTSSNMKTETSNQNKRKRIAEA